MAGLSDMTEGSPAGLLLRFAIPAVIGNMVEQLYMVADRIIVGRYVGAQAFSAIGSTSALIYVFMAVCVGLENGTGVVVAQHYGAGDGEHVASAIRNGLLTAAASAAFMSFMSLILAAPLLRLLGTPEDLLSDAASYMMIYLAGLPAIAVCFTSFHILRALGNSRIPMVFLVVSSVMNVFLDMLFIIWFRMGVAGAALATVLSQTTAAVLCVIYAYRKIPYFKDAVKKAGFDSSILGQIIRLALPSGGQYALTYVSGSVLQSVVNGFGLAAIGAFTATNQVDSLIRHIYLGIGSAVSAYTGQNIGAGKQDRVRLGMNASMKILAVISVILFGVFWLAGRPIMSLFVTDESIVEMASAGIRITSLFYMGLGVKEVLHYLLSGAGDAVYPMIGGVVEVVCRVGLAFLLTGTKAIGVWGIWMTTGLVWLIAALLALWRYRSGAWKDKALVQGL